ncbi:MAG TPA: hypothetical protein VI911_08925 [Patescibacteria group bacterium]|nr:MAG: hypothetical protein UR43_C0005G0047 [candidate division TM6 bacterium GW2011_GWF2_33_332]HLD91120.1 hypothetical protein [Patescibacteria group bacterium]
MENYFNEEDKEKFIEFINTIAKKAEFNHFKTQDIIDYFKLLSYIQTKFIPKLDANILEVKRIIKSKESKVE